jgi:catechol 2,3-dioxygenase-like lactoylglutathione lyase family enzyme
LSELLGAGVRLEHVAVAARSADHPLIGLAGFPAGVVRSMPSGVRVARHGPLEVVVPEREGSPVDRFLETRGAGLHHVALGVADPLEDVITRLAAAGIRAVGPIEPGSDGRRTAFLNPRAMGGVLVELVETRGS